MIEHLNTINNVEIKSVFDKSFKTYGKVIEGYDFTEIVEYMKTTPMPEANNIYIASCEDMENMEVAHKVQQGLYGGLEIQVGYCNGRNSTYNGLEYHKCSELNVAVTDMMMVLGHVWDMENNTFNVDDVEVFFVPQGTVLEMYQTTLHLSPCKVTDEGFRAVVILLKGTNDTTFEKPEHITKEDEILLFKNKWIIAHPQREPLVKAGAYTGLIGENKQLKY
ncbi:MAG: hypothetical protein ATN34_01210 [Epulopiscium sp. Nele67-Bin002]|nr:MAG: DUF4867 domain-containing protein [Epulopiscium sp. Nuni2H_MBin001]OON91862.1 MAG: hypothetical protein ATN34_01210 [Epulopiscium sp. Nele67-Bin002]OON92493.1 MAG: DUF4867 domain-containing protein [Epulopiscium sp. Nele67-Bin001]